jgi:multisubunit Na+/H+ antiporter MnhE subunit
MFPAGAAGYGLLILRFCAAAMLMHQTMNSGSSVFTIWVLVVASVIALLLCLGVLTPFSCVASGIVQISTQLHHDDCLPRFIFSLAVTIALFLLGPGAVSIDAHLFGRRRIVSSN